MDQSRKARRARYRLSTYIGLARRFKPNSLLHFLARFLPGGFTAGFIVRPWLHRWRGVKIGHEVYLGDDIYIDEDFPETVEIQDGARIAPRCTLIGHTKGPGKLIIEKRAAIGAGCVISCVAGQTLRIGEGAVVAAGSTVLNDVPPFTLSVLPGSRLTEP